MALLTPLNVNCHASDGRKVRAARDAAAVGCTSGGRSGCNARTHSLSCVYFDLILKESAEFGR